MRFVRTLLTLGFSILIVSLLVKPFFYFDPESNCFIKVIPSIQPSNWNVYEALSLVKQSAPEYYTYMCKNVTTINKNVSCGGFDGGCFYSNTKRTIYVGNDQNNIPLTAAIVIHELCHAQQDEQERSLNEAECYAKGAQFLGSITQY